MCVCVCVCLYKVYRMHNVPLPMCPVVEKHFLSTTVSIGRVPEGCQSYIFPLQTKKNEAPRQVCVWLEWVSACVQPYMFDLVALTDEMSCE